MKFMMGVDPNFKDGKEGDWRMVITRALEDDRNVKIWEEGWRNGYGDWIEMRSYAGPRIRIKKSDGQ